MVISKQFQEYLGDQGSVLDAIPDYTPQLNGTAERNVRTAVNMMRSMFESVDVPLPKYFWTEAICTSCYIKNRFTSTKEPTSFEMWTGEKPDISHFRVYECKPYKHATKQKRKSLDDRPEECILLGCGTGSTYPLMTKSRRIVVARNVNFVETSLLLRDVNNDYATLYLDNDDQEYIPTPEEQSEDKKIAVLDESRLSAGPDKSLKSSVGVRRYACLQAMREAKKKTKRLWL